MSLTTTTLLNFFICLTFSQFPYFNDQNFYQVDTCINQTTGSRMYRCTTVNDYQAVREYVYDTDDCTNEEDMSESDYYAGTTYGGCDQTSRDLYMVSGCSTAQSGVENGDCAYFQLNPSSNRLPLNKCRLDDTCSTSGDSCYTMIDTSDGNMTLIENGYDTYDCTGDIMYTQEWSIDDGEVEAYNNGNDDCFVTVLEYRFSNVAYQFCNNDEDKWKGPSGIIQNPLYYYHDADTTSMSYDDGIIDDVQPKVIGECYGYQQGYSQLSVKYECDDENSRVNITLYEDTLTCKKKANSYIYSSHSYTDDDNYHTCGSDNDASKKTVKGKYDTELHYLDSLNTRAQRSSGALGCKACYPYYADYADRSYPEQNIKVVRSTMKGGNFMVYDFYFNGTCDTPLVTYFEPLDSLSGNYPAYEMSKCENKRNKNVRRKYLKKYYDGVDSYFDTN